jgi:TonB family protein
MFCTTSLSAQYKLDVKYSFLDKRLVSYGDVTIPLDTKENTITPPSASGTLRIPVSIDAAGLVTSPKRIDFPQTFEDIVANQVSSFIFSENDYSSSEVITVNYSTSSEKPLKYLEFPTTSDPDNLVSFLYFCLFEDSPKSPEKQAITLNVAKTLLNIAKVKDYSWPSYNNNRQNIYNFINNGTLFWFDSLINEDSQELVAELSSSNSNPATRRSVELLNAIQQVILHNYNSRVLKLALQDIDKSGYDWEAAVSNKVWGNNPASLIVPKHKQSWTSLMEFVTKTLPNNPEAVVVSKIRSPFSRRYYNEYDAYGMNRNWNWDKWIEMSLDYDFEKEFIEKIEKYKIMGHPSDDKEKVSELIGCALLRAKLIAYKNSQTVFDPYVLRLLKDGNKFEITVEPELPSSGGFSLAGRHMIGSLPSPAYIVEVEGRVVIRITVNAAGMVISADYEQAGSTTNNNALVNAAREAALRARFSPAETELQSGTITYLFRLN